MCLHIFKGGEKSYLEHCQGAGSRVKSQPSELSFAGGTAMFQRLLALISVRLSGMNTQRFRSVRWIVESASCILTVLCLLQTGAWAATQTVSNTNDSGTGSLRYPPHHRPDLDQLGDYDSGAGREVAEHHQRQWRHEPDLLHQRLSSQRGQSFRTDDRRRERWRCWRWRHRQPRYSLCHRLRLPGKQRHQRRRHRQPHFRHADGGRQHVQL